MFIKAHDFARFNPNLENLTAVIAEMKEKYEFLKEVDSMALLYTAKRSERAFKNNVSIRYRTRENFRSYATFSKSISIANDSIKLPLIKKVAMRPITYAIPDDASVVSATITHRRNHYDLSILYRKPEPPAVVTPRTKSNTLGLDFSMVHLYVDSNGNKPNFPVAYKEMVEKVFEKRRELENAKNIEEKNEIEAQYNKIIRKIKKRQKGEYNAIAIEIAKKYDYVAVENLDLRVFHKNPEQKFRAWLLNWSGFLHILKTQLQKRGKKYHKAQDLNIKEWECPYCGDFHNCDENAAKNLRDFCVDPVKFKEANQ